MGSRGATIDILGVAVACIDGATALDRIEGAFRRGAPARVVYANAHALNLACRDPRFRRVLSTSDLVLNDGIGLSLAARLQGARFVENLNGSDFNPRILERAALRGWRVFLLGGRAGVARRAADRLTSRIPGLVVAGTRHGYMDHAEESDVAAEIRDARTDLLMVAMGNPTQELWLERNLAATGARIGIGVGAFFDFTAGEVARAPEWMNRAGIEWVWRLAQEPGRMWRRYLIGNPEFLARALHERVTRGR